MGRTARDKRPNVPPVEKIELDARHTKVRLALAVFFFIVGIVILVVALHSALTTEPGWAEIEVESSDLNCSRDFSFLYPLGTNDTATREHKALVNRYTGLCVSAYRIFTNDATFDGLYNVHSINERPNEELLLDPALYHAFEEIVESGDRSIYLAPICEVYGNIFQCSDPAQTIDFDPRRNEELRAWFAQICAYANDPKQIHIELPEENHVRLFVSEEYLTFAEEEEIGSFIDFHWMRNAFIADYLAEQLQASGYHSGILASSDGFMRNLDAHSDDDYALNVLDRNETGALLAGVLHYNGARSIVSLRDFPASDGDLLRYALLPDGSFATSYLSTADGLCRAAVPCFNVYSETANCAQLTLRIASVYIASGPDAQALAELTTEGIHCIYAADGILHHTEAGITLTDLAEGYREEALTVS